MIFQNPPPRSNPVITSAPRWSRRSGSTRRSPAPRPGGCAGAALARRRASATPSGCMSRYPFQLSGGMNQRVMIAMAMIDAAGPAHRRRADDRPRRDHPGPGPRAARAPITHEHDTALILITHDIALVREYVDRVVVLYAGPGLRERAGRRGHRAARAPLHAGAAGSVPRADLAPGERLAAIPGELPDPRPSPRGCPFAPRCRYVMDVCRDVDPPLRAVGAGSRWPRATSTRSPGAEG